MVEASLNGAPVPSGKGGKKGAKAAANGSASGGGLSKNGTLLKDFRLEYAKSGGSKCGVCEEKIKKVFINLSTCKCLTTFSIFFLVPENDDLSFQNEVRAGKKDFESQRAKMYGPFDRWHHIPCFVKQREELEYFDDGEAMGGFMTLSPDDQAMVKSAIKAMKRKSPSNGSDEPDSKKMKVEKVSDEDKEALKKQMKKIFYYRDLLQKMNKKELQDLLEYNGQEVCTGVDRMLDRLGDCMTFGALEPCTECDNGQLVFKSGVGYQCQGDVSEWTKCQFKTTDPKRKAFKIPQEFKEEYTFMNLYKFKEVTQRIIPHNPTTVKPKEDTSTKAKQDFPLKGAIFVVNSSVKGDQREKLKEKIKAFGGILEDKVTSKTLALIATKDAMEKEPSKSIKTAEEKKIQVVCPQVLDNVKVEGIISNIKTYTISSWGTDPESRFKREEPKEKLKSGKNYDQSDKNMSIKLFTFCCRLWFPKERYAEKSQNETERWRLRRSRFRT